MMWNAREVVVRRVIERMTGDKQNALWFHGEITSVKPGRLNNGHTRGFTVVSKRR